MGRLHLRHAPIALALFTFVIFMSGCGTPAEQLQLGGLSGNPLINGAAPTGGSNSPQNGADGANGASGASGASGANGSSGTSGTNGTAGLQGATGATGPAGPQGEPGAAGATGPQGPAGPPGPAGASPFSLVQNNAVYMQGSVGIGTTTPHAKLHIAELTDAMSILRIESGATSSQYAGIDFVDRGKPTWGIGKDNINDFYVDDHGQRRVTIKPSTGLMGIGAVDPVSRLDVRNGNISVTNGIAKTRFAAGLSAGVDSGFVQVIGPDDKVMSGMGGGARGSVFVQNSNGVKVGEMAVTAQGQGIIIADVIQAAVKNFCIDHPLDPENKLLIHTSVESSEMMNLYSGNVVTDDKGNAEVTLPDWFEALNGEFRYQLTPIGQFAQCIIAEKIKENRFVIRTDKPQVEVSWQVTAVRHDDWAVHNRSPVEVAKAPADQGKLIRPVDR